MYVIYRLNSDCQTRMPKSWALHVTMTNQENEIYILVTKQWYCKVWIFAFHVLRSITKALQLAIWLRLRYLKAWATRFFCRNSRYLETQNIPHVHMNILLEETDSVFTSTQTKIQSTNNGNFFSIPQRMKLGQILFLKCAKQSYPPSSTALQPVVKQYNNLMILTRSLKKCILVQRNAFYFWMAIMVAASRCLIL